MNTCKSKLTQVKPGTLHTLKLRCSFAHTHKSTHLAVNLVAAQRGLNDVEQSICQAITLSHPASRLLTCRAYIPVTQTPGALVRVCALVPVFAK